MRQQQQPPIEAVVGYAADQRGEGIAYARLRSATGTRILRLSFRIERFAGLNAREVSYGALSAVSAALLERGVTRARLAVADEALVRDINEHRDVPPPLVLPYVRLRCALNRFAEHAVVIAEGDCDLAERARAEAALHIAA